MSAFARRDIDRHHVARPWLGMLQTIEILGAPLRRLLDEVEEVLVGIAQAVALWARHGISIDPQDYDRKRRAEWTRSWDDDYEEVRAESPDMFDEYDDRERAHYLSLTKKAAAKYKKKAA